MFDIIAQDALVICMFAEIVHIAFIIYVTWYKYAMAYIIALHMHGDIALNGCECMVGKSTQRLVFGWVGSVKSDNIQQSYTVEYDVCFYIKNMIFLYYNI